MLTFGAFHYICGYDTYNEMKVSIQGNYESMSSKVYTNNTFLNSNQGDRGMLVKMMNGSTLSNAYRRVAEVKGKPASIEKNINIQIHDMMLYTEYISLKNEIKKYQSIIGTLKTEEKEYSNLIKNEKLKERKIEYKKDKKIIQEKILYNKSNIEEIKKQLMHYQTLVKIPMRSLPFHDNKVPSLFRLLHN